MTDKPLCGCHQEPMYRDYKGGGKGIGWRCAVKKRAANERHYARLHGVALSRRMLQQRRHSALRRRALRHQRTED